MSFSDIWNGPSFLNRKPSALRMAKRDAEGKRKSKDGTKEQIKHEHFRKDWDADLWD
jgi:hypothetical protein